MSLPFGGVSSNLEDGSCLLPRICTYLCLQGGWPCAPRSVLLWSWTCRTQRKPPLTSLAQSCRVGCASCHVWKVRALYRAEQLDRTSSDRWGANQKKFLSPKRSSTYKDQARGS